MSKRMLNMSVVAVLAAGAAAVSNIASAAPFYGDAAVKRFAGKDAIAIPVWYRDWDRDYYYHGRAFPGGAMTAAPYYYCPYSYCPPCPPAYDYAAARRYREAVAYCALRYRSWDPETGTFIGYDGLLHPCP